MRIISGKYKGRVINSPKKFSTHPMSEKMRGAIFNAMGDIEDLCLLDAYAGSGAIAIEAISRGAEMAVAIDSDKDAVNTIIGNVKSLNITAKVTVAQANCVSYLANQPQLFDIVVCDPPYNDVKKSQLKVLAQYVKPSGLFVLSLPPNLNELTFGDFILLKFKSYGDATVWYFRKY